MNDPIHITTPLTPEVIRSLRAGDEVRISGVVYTARDAAHKRLIDAMTAGASLPMPLEGSIIYYVGPTPAPPGHAIGSAGPTTAGRMDSYAPALIAKGLSGMMAKGKRSAEVIDACRTHGAAYFAATSTAALLSKCIVEAEIIAYEELGPEAVRKLTVKDFPAVVIVDAFGADFYDIGRARWRKETP